MIGVFVSFRSDGGLDREKVMAVAEQCAPGTLNYLEPDPEIPLRIVSETTAMPIRYAMSNNIGLGGHNAAVIFKRYDGD